MTFTLEFLNFSATVDAKIDGVMWFAGVSINRRAKFWPSANMTPFSKSATMLGGILNKRKNTLTYWLKKSQKHITLFSCKHKKKNHRNFLEFQVNDNLRLV